MTEVSPVGVPQNISVAAPQNQKETPNNQQQVQMQPQTPEVAPAIVDKAASDAASSYAIAAINSQTPKV